MNSTPQGERTRIVLLGRCNVGKSSLINALADQPVAIVSPVKGTTTDPVRKAMEILPIGPVLLCDTPGLDDAGNLGALRMARTQDELRQADLALVVTDAATGIGPLEADVINKLRDAKTPHLVVFNRIDEYGAPDRKADERTVFVSALTGQGIDDLKEAIIKALPDDARRPIASDLVRPGDVVVLVTPIDSAAPKGRLILPQQQVIRDLLDAGVMPLVTRETELARALAALAAPPALVITDSQAFAAVAAILPPDAPLTSFSILFARYKGDLAALAAGAEAVANLRDGDRVLIAEGCTHHRQEDDIGTVKIPRLLGKKTGRRLVFEHAAGMRYPADLASYALVVHCGGCMLNRREMLHRIASARAAGVPIVNYGVLLACLNGILPRALAPLSPTRR
ncbi:MAG: [Kiritimatiellae bacterium]|nr:[FeFe] hydrogenase H-cluster maturation GTPase HydF [Kiritimatiellia bacterium]